MNRQEQNLLLLLRSAICEESVVLSEPDHVEILRLAQKHSVGNMLYTAVKRLPEEQQPDTLVLPLERQLAVGAVSREVIQEQELKQIFDIFEKNGIPAVPLKGAVLKYLYPSPGLRYMSDIDLLIRPEDASGVNKLVTEMGFKTEVYNNGSTDIYISPMGMKYEVKKNLAGESVNAQTVKFAERLMECTTASKGGGVHYLPKEEHYIYVLCHMAKHMLYGGIGIRVIADVWLCNQKWDMDRSRLNRMLKSLGLFEFDTIVCKLATVWFGSETASDEVKALEDYILGSGTFGTDQQMVTNSMLLEQKTGSKVRYLFRRLFPSYRDMRFYFPILRKAPVLLPVFWVVRMIRSILFRRGKLKEELRTVERTDDSALQRRDALFKSCGLDVSQKG